MTHPNLARIQSVVKRYKLKGQDMAPALETKDIPAVIRDYYAALNLKIYRAKRPVKSTITVKTTCCLLHTWYSVGKTWELQ